MAIDVQKRKKKLFAFYKSLLLYFHYYQHQSLPIFHAHIKIILFFVCVFVFSILVDFQKRKMAKGSFLLLFCGTLTIRNIKEEATCNVTFLVPSQ